MNPRMNRLLSSLILGLGLTLGLLSVLHNPFTKPRTAHAIIPYGGSIGTPGGSNTYSISTTKINYISTTETLPNPERGFYYQFDTHDPSKGQTADKDYVLLDEVPGMDGLIGYRQDEHVTLILRVFYLNDYVDSDISSTYLGNMQDDFNTVRNAGMKVIVRFAYTNTDSATWPPVPPYGDATKERVLAHLDDLSDVLRRNSDVIAVVQAGFIGIWGEWYYTDHFVQDPSHPEVVTATDYISRGEVLTKTLAVLPSTRMVQIRTPLNKQQIFDPQFPREYTPPGVGEGWALDPEDAHNGSDIARTGHHNDCFLASDDDFGTYANIPEDKAYLAKETLYLPMGGETCYPNPPRSDCITATAELSRFHWSYIKIDHLQAVIDSWKEQDCYPEIERRLGYRFTLLEGTYDNQVMQDDDFHISLRLKNDGYAAPFNPRAVKLMLHTDGSTYTFELKDDPRFWLPGETHTISQTIRIPCGLLTGTYRLLLGLPDPEPVLRDRNEYAIRFANENVWDASTGYNKLNHSVIVNPGTCATYLPIIWKSRHSNQRLIRCQTPPPN